MFLWSQCCLPRLTVRRRIDRLSIGSCLYSIPVRCHLALLVVKGRLDCLSLGECGVDNDGRTGRRSAAITISLYSLFIALFDILTIGC